MPSFSEITLKCLTRAGWYPGRQVKIDDYVAFLEHCGNPVHMCVRQFLTEYGRMKVKHPHSLDSKEQDFFRMDPIAANQFFYLDGDGLEDYNVMAGTKLCTIGLGFGDNLLLLMAENGQVFGAESTELYPIGLSGEEAIEKMCTGTAFPEDLT